MTTVPNAQAFPVPPGGSAGMTVREYFAAAAMQGILAYLGSPDEFREQVAADAVRCADALVAALNKQ